MIRRMIAAATAVLLGVALTGCSANDSLAQQYQEGNEKGYIAGDFRVVEIAAGERGADGVETAKLKSCFEGDLIVRRVDVAKAMASEGMLPEVFQECRDRISRESE